ncbi:MAG: GGDEF domain-containing protein, partial [Balneolaceae bacterium]
ILNKGNDNQLEDIVEFDDRTLSLADIESIANDKNIRKHYENKYKDCLYSTILLSLTHESFREDESKSLWNEIISHMRQLEDILGRSVGLSVASLDYLTNVKKALLEPKIIEENKSTFIAGATTKDELTGLYLREVFDVVLKKEMEEANRKNTSLCLLMIDIDDFKKINDQYGHLKGDEVLKKVGTAINNSVREMDLAARYGGEEIAIIIPRVNIEQTFNAAQRIRKTIEEIQFKDFFVTVSIGLSQTNRLIDTPDKLIHTADLALYKAKNKGKNQVIMSDKTD